MSRCGHLFVISGPSGAGKGTIVARMQKSIPDIWNSISATTRKPRAGETDGVQYYFLSRSDFEQKIANGEFLEWAEYDGNLYGTLAAPIKEKIAAGCQVVLEIEVQGAAQVREKMPECTMIFIEPPSLQILEERLRARGTNTEESISERMETAKVELSRKLEYDYVLVNDELEAATEQLTEFVNKVADEDRCTDL